ncbi:MAG: hypothetical protein SF339_23815 [Blastocatellia bacterium]|nr:hypothetical protein [Blastocatellia bacterium]
MALNAKHRRSKRRALRRAVRGGISRLRKQVLHEKPSATPSDAEPSASHHEAGVLRPDAASWRLPDGLAEAGENDNHAGHGWIPGPVVVTITLAALLFSSLIAWFVSQMPEKP